MARHENLATMLDKKYWLAPSQHYAKILPSRYVTDNWLHELWLSRGGAKLENDALLSINSSLHYVRTYA
jgi:hypothetical protein